jgi:hypothetical protein
VGRLQGPEAAQGGPPRGPVVKFSAGGGNGDVSLVLMLETEIEMKLCRPRSASVSTGTCQQLLSGSTALFTPNGKAIGRNDFLG